MLLRQGEKSPAAGLVVVSENGEEEKESCMGRSNETRPVMGRPIIYPQGRQTVLLSLPAELVPVLKELGGSHWVRDRLREVVAEREKKDKVM